MTTVTNAHGKVLDYKAAENMMDETVAEAVHMAISPCTEQEFFDAYCVWHFAKYGESWELDKPNPVW